jgi:hypothetical protein
MLLFLRRLIASSMEALISKVKSGFLTRSVIAYRVASQPVASGRIGNEETMERNG